MKFKVSPIFTRLFGRKALEEELQLPGTVSYDMNNVAKLGRELVVDCNKFLLKKVTTLRRELH